MLFLNQQLILGIIILSAKIIFADILVQPGYQYQRTNNLFYPQYQYATPALHIMSAEYAKQLTDYLNYLSKIDQPNYVPKQNLIYQNKVRSNFHSGYPYHSLHHYPYHHYISKGSPGKLHYVKLGGHEYVRPSIFIARSNPLAAHYRRKRSTDVKFSKPAIATYDVATKPSLIDKYPTTDSLLPENKSTNTNDKNHQSEFATFLFGLNPNKMYSKLQDHSAKDLNEKKSEHSISKRNHITINSDPTTRFAPVVLTQQPDPIKQTIVTESVQQTSTPQEKKQNQEPSRIEENLRQENPRQENLRLVSNVPLSTNLKQSSSPITTSRSSKEESHENYDKDNNNDNTPYAFVPIMPIAHQYPSVPYAFKYWPNYKHDYVTYDIETQPSNTKKYSNQQYPRSNYPIGQQISNKVFSKETTNIDTAKPKQDVIKINFCPEGSPCLKNEVVGASEPNTQVFYTIPNDYTNYYLNDYLEDNKDDYLNTYYNSLKTDYEGYDTPTYLTNGFQYIKAYSNNVPSNNCDNYNNMFYENINDQSDIAPTTYRMVSTSSKIPQTWTQLSNEYYYPKKTDEIYISYSPQPSTYYKNDYDMISSSYEDIPKEFDKPSLPSVYYV